jgi:hypothetical protein
MTQSVTPEMMPGVLRLIWPVFKLMTRPDEGKSVAEAAFSSIHLASSPDVEGVNGEYRDSKREVTPWLKPVLEEATRRGMWLAMERLTQESDGS